ncbi:MAG: hypothetical protein PUE11_01550, partial [Paraprevotella sp.]|nr:hypothetical protein [Paraprevotella sp.]
MKQTTDRIKKRGINEKKHLPNPLPFYENSIILCSTETKCVKLKRYSNQKRYLKTETKLKNMKYKHHLLSLCGVAIAVLCV